MPTPPARLAKLALFSNDEEVRSASVAALAVRRERDYTEILMQGFRYPWPAAARRASQALIKLGRTDLVPRLLEVLEQPDPRLPVLKQVEGQPVPVVRELVRINHHRNCLLCHAPVMSPDDGPGMSGSEFRFPASRCHDSSPFGKREVCGPMRTWLTSDTTSR